MSRSIYVPALGRIDVHNRDGSEVRFTEIARRWQGLGHRFTYLIPQREEPLLRAAGLTGEYRILGERQASRENIYFTYARRITRACAMPPPSRVDLIYCPSDFLHDLLPAIQAKRLRPQAKLAVCLFLVAPMPWRGYAHTYRGQPGIVRPTVRSSLYWLTQRLGIALMRRFADIVFVLNKHDHQRVVELGLPSSLVAVTTMGVDLASYRPSSHSTPKFDAAFVGRIHPQKGIDDLLLAWKRVCRERPRSRLVVVAGGSTGVQAALRTRIRTLGLEDAVTFTGFQEGVTKLRLLQSSRCFVFPSTYESWGMAACEALACGLPVIAYDLPIYRELFRDGLLTAPVGNVAALADQILTVLTLPNARLDDLRLRARSAVRAYDWNVVAARDWQCLEQLFVPEPVPRSG